MFLSSIWSWMVQRSLREPYRHIRQCLCSRIIGFLPAFHCNCKGSQQEYNRMLSKCHVQQYSICSCISFYLQTKNLQICLTDPSKQFLSIHSNPPKKSFHINDCNNEVGRISKTNLGVFKCFSRLGMFTITYIRLTTNDMETIRNLVQGKQEEQQTHSQ